MIFEIASLYPSPADVFLERNSYIISVAFKKVFIRFWKAGVRNQHDDFPEDKIWISYGVFYLKWHQSDFLAKFR